jgi:hypothetical protein
MVSSLNMRMESDLRRWMELVEARLIPISHTSRYGSLYQTVAIENPTWSQIKTMAAKSADHTIRGIIHGSVFIIVPGYDINHLYTREALGMAPGDPGNTDFWIVPETAAMPDSSWPEPDEKSPRRDGLVLLLGRVTIETPGLARLLRVFVIPS